MEGVENYLHNKTDQEISLSRLNSENNVLIHVDNKIMQGIIIFNDVKLAIK